MRLYLSQKDYMVFIDVDIPFLIILCAQYTLLFALREKLYISHQTPENGWSKKFHFNLMKTEIFFKSVFSFLCLFSVKKKALGN